MSNEFIVKNGLIVGGNVVTSGTITINGALAATQSWVTSQAYLTSASLSGYATQSYVTSALAALVDAAPAALDTLNELAAALGDDASFSTTITNSIAAKLPLAGGTLTGDLTLNYGYPRINFYDDNHNPDYSLINNDGGFSLYDITNNVHRIWVSSVGNTGIGTTSPDTKLHVWNGDSGGAPYEATGITIESSGRAALNFLSGAGNDAYVFFGNSSSGNAGYVGYENTANRLVLRSSDYISLLDSTGEVIRIDNGNVGVGTVTPNDKLIVNGNIGVEYAGYFGFYRYSGTIHTFSTDGITSAMFGIAGGVFSGRSDAGLTVSGYDQLRFYTENSERIRINRAGKVSIGTTDTNSDKSDFTVYTGAGATIALTYDQVRMGGTDVNWGVAIRQSGSFETYGQALILGTLNGNYPINVIPNGTTSAQFYTDYTYFPGLDFAISRVNSTHGAGNYFRGDGSHLVIGTGGTLYLNYANTSGTTYIFGTTYVNNEQVATRAWVGSQGYLTSVSDIWVNTAGDTMTGTLSFAQPVGLSFANGQYIKDNNSGGLIINSGAAVNITGTSIAVTGAATFSSSVTIGSRLALQPSNFGYASSYKTLLIGSAGTDYTTNAVSLAFNVDISGNPSGAFTGNGYEYIWRNTGAFITPNAANTSYNTLFSWNSSGQLTFPAALTVDTDILTRTKLQISNGRLFELIGSSTALNIYDASAGASRIYITSVGKVGIGTTAPAEEFHVLGRAIFDGGSGDSSTDAVVYVTKSNNNDWGLYINAAALDYGMYARVSPSAGYAIAIHNGTSWTTRITGDGRIYLNEKDTIASYDGWLRLNSSAHYTSGVYTPYALRNDGAFDNYGGIYGYNTIRARKLQTVNNYTTAALWTESYDLTTTGIAFHISGIAGKFLEMRTNGVLYWENSQVWTASTDGSGSGLDADLLDGQHGSYFINTSNIGSQSVSYASSAGSATTSTSTYRGIIEDTRTAERTPNDYDDYRVSWEFTNQIPGLSGNTSWWSVMTMQGWHNGYSAWQIIGSSSSAIDDFYLRAGNNTTWNTARRIWHSGDFTSSNISNWNTAYGWGNHASAGYLTSYSETDTLQSVTSRGNSTYDRINVRGIGNQGGGNIMMGNVGEGTNKWSYLTGTHYNASSQPQGFALIGGLATSGGNAVVIGGNIYETNPATEIQFWTHGTNTHNLGGTQRGVINSAGNWGIGTNSPGYKLHVAGESYTSGVIRIGGTNPFYFEDYGGGWFMSDSSWVRTSNSKSVWVGGGLLGGDGGLTIGYGGTGSPSGGAIIAGNVGIGTTTPAEKLSVVGNVSVTSGEYRLYNNSTVLSATSGSLLSINAGGFSNVSIVNGNFGIGTTSPGAKLHVVGNTYIQSGVLFVDTIAGYATNLVSLAASTNVLVPSGDITIGSGASTSSTQPFGDFSQLKFDNLHSDTNRGPNKIVMHDNGNAWIGGFGIHSDTVSYYTGGHHRWYKTDSQTSSSQVMQLDASGNLTIAGTLSASGYNKSNWDTAYSWGNHASYSYATTSYVTTQINNLINGAPGVLDTLDELAAALGDDANFATTVTNSIAGKVSKSGDTMTGNLTTTGLTVGNGVATGRQPYGPLANANIVLNSSAADSSGVCGIEFLSGNNYPSDGASIYFQNNAGGGSERAKLTLRVENDLEDFIELRAGKVVINANTYSGGGQNPAVIFQHNDSQIVSITSGGQIDASGGNSSQWNTAYGWGNHASAGYALNSSLANYLPLSGGVIGGGVTINGNLTVNGTITENSSLKLKENIETSEGNLEKVVNLRPVTYNKIGSQTTELGLIAEEVAEVYPEFVQYDENGEPIGVHYSRLTAALIGAVKELTNQVQELNKKING